MTTRTGKKLVAAPRHMKQYHDFVGRVEARKLHTKAMMRKIMDTIVDNVYGHVIDELKGFVHQISVHGDNDRATTSGEGCGSNGGASSGNVLNPTRKRRAPSPPSSSTHIPSDGSTFDDTALNAFLDASLSGNSQSNYDVQFESSSSLHNAQSAENASLSVNAAPLPSNAQPSNAIQNNVQEDAQALDNVQSNKAHQTMQPFNASENAENILENGIEVQNAEEPSVHNAVINGNNGGGDNDLDNAHYYDALDDFHDDALDNSQDNARDGPRDNSRDNALDNFQGDAQDNSQDNLNNASENENSFLLDNTSQLSSIVNDSSILSQSSGGDDNNSNNSETVRISNEVVANAQQQQQEDSGNSSLESSPEVTEKYLNIVERLMKKALAKGPKNAQNKDQNISKNNSQSVSQNSDDGPTTSTPIVQNRTTYWRMIKQERRRLEQQQANVTMQQQLDNAQQENDATTITTTTVDSVKIKEELNDGTTAVEVTMPADSGLSSPSGSINGSNLSLSQSPPLLPFPPPIFNPTQAATPSTSTQSSAVKKQKVVHVNNREPKMAPTKRNKLPWTNRRKNPVLLPPKPAASASSSMIPIAYCTAGTSSAGSKASRVIYPKKFKGALPRGRILVKAIRCYLCRGLLTSRTELYRHLKTVHRVKPLRCPLTDCAETFDIVQQFGGHIAQKHKRNFHWPCTECPRPTDPSVPPVVFERCHDLNTHIRYTHEEGIFGCPVADCEFEAETGHLVTEHYNAAHRTEGDGSLVREQSVLGGDESMAAAGDVPIMPGDEQMVSSDFPLVSGDAPMAPEEPMPGGAQQLKPVTDEQEKKKIKTEEQVIKTELTDEQIRQMVMQQYAQVYPRHVMQCPWFGCDYSNPSCMVMATHVQTVHLATLWAQPVAPPQPQLPQEQQPQESIEVPVEVKKEPEQDAEPQQQRRQQREVVKNQTQEPKKTNQLVIKEEIDESNNNQPIVRK